MRRSQAGGSVNREALQAVRAGWQREIGGAPAVDVPGATVPASEVSAASVKGGV